LIFVQIAFGQHSNDKAQTPKTTTQVLLDQTLSENDLKDNNMVRMETVIFPPAYSSKKHTHPCPLFVYVLEGELLSEFEGVRKVYKAGDTFYEKPSGVHSITKNNSTTVPAKILVIYLMKEGVNTFIPVEH
jgi:quercetin dioxygenase-like cupin family protein